MFYWLQQQQHICSRCTLVLGCGAGEEKEGQSPATLQNTKMFLSGDDPLSMKEAKF